MHDLLPDLRRIFGFPAFRPGQERVVRAAVAGTDTLALMPTGSGKSLTYQLAAMLRPRPTLVLSPLIALMKDQVDKLPPELAAVSTFVNSSLPPEETAARVAGLAEGRYRLLYAAPERLRQYEFVEALRAAGVGFVVVDEVHCVSMWGHDFRPDYLFIRRALETFGSPPVLGMTATASPSTEREIAAALGRRFDVVRTTVVRPNLRYDVERVEGEEDRLRSLLSRLKAQRGASAIVYARSRRSCERLARLLRQHGFNALHYHAGLESEERTAAQEAFLDGRAQIVVATTAFGMGIDKPDIRLVVLYNLPDSLESYVQMVGRAGRDGEPSGTVLFCGRADARALERFAVGDVPSPDELVSVLRLVRERPVLEPEELAAVVGEGVDPRVIVGMLEQIGLVRRGFDQGRAMHVQAPPPPADAAARIDELLHRSETVAIERARRLIGFAESARCRHAQVADHFGESLAGECGACDVCSPDDRSHGAAAADAEGRPAPPLPADAGAAILAAVRSLEWPLGRTGLAAMLQGSVSAPPSARRSPHFGRSPIGESGGREALDSPARGRRLPRDIRDGRRLQAPARRARGGSAAHRDRRGAGGRGPVRTAPRVATRPGAERRGARLRRPARPDAEGARQLEAAVARRSGARQWLRPDEARALRRRRPRRDRRRSRLSESRMGKGG